MKRTLTIPMVAAITLAALLVVAVAVWAAAPPTCTLGARQLQTPPTGSLRDGLGRPVSQSDAVSYGDGYWAGAHQAIRSECGQGE